MHPRVPQPAAAPDKGGEGSAAEQRWVFSTPRPSDCERPPFLVDYLVVLIVFAAFPQPSSVLFFLTLFDGDTEQFRVSFSAVGSADSDPFMLLDRDDRDGDGPETITISRHVATSYCYSVHDFSNQNDEGSSALADSGARVDVYAQGALRASFSVPGASGTVWTVLRIEEGEIVPIESVSYGTPPGACR